VTLADEGKKKKVNTPVEKAALIGTGEGRIRGRFF